MNSEKFNDFVINNVITNNKFGINEINKLENLASRLFLVEEYSDIEKLIGEGNIQAIKLLPDNNSQSGEYLDIYSFEDQNGNKYIVTVYDSIALEQDPQVIEIYKI